MRFNLIVSNMALATWPLYTNVWQVQCSNIHFHAHSDGSTTLHRHKTCRRLSQDSIYAFDDVDADADVNVDKSREADTEVVETLKKPPQKSKSPKDVATVAKVKMK